MNVLKWQGVKIYDHIKNVLLRGEEHYSRVFYIVESPNWSIKWDGIQIIKNLNSKASD